MLSYSPHSAYSSNDASRFVFVREDGLLAVLKIFNGAVGAEPVASAKFWRNTSVEKVASHWTTKRFNAPKDQWLRASVELQRFISDLSL